jgi:tetratricopeptide (TPR) repeat protein
VKTKDRSQFLIIDDKQLILSLTSRMLRNNGYKNYITAFSAASGLYKLKKNSINFIIVDWDMPYMTGIEFLIYIRKNLQLFNLPVLIMSENLTDRKIFYAMEEGVDGCMEKPFSETEFIGAINHVFQAQLDPDPMKYPLQRLRSLTLQKKYKDAIAFGKSLLQQGENINVHIGLGECYFNCKKYQSAKEILLKSVGIKETYKAYHLLGKICLEEGDNKEAIKFLEKAYFINPMNTAAVVDMGSAYLNLGFTKEAAEAFGTLKDNNLTDLNNTNIGSAYLNVGEIDKAGKYLNEAQNPLVETVNVFNKYAIELRKAGRLEEALEQYQRCLKIDPENHIITLNFAAVYIEMKDYREARKLLERCLEIDPNYETAIKLLQFVKSKI